MYLIKSFESYDKKNWGEVENLEIANYPWDNINYKPKVKIQLFHTNEAIYVKFTATEKSLVINTFEHNGSVYKDSCVEFFFAPVKDDERYMNFEINAIGKLLLQIGKTGAERETLINEDFSIFNIESSANKDNLEDFKDFKPWTVEYKIPFEFIKKFYENFSLESKLEFKGNFYKCGDKTEVAHYGCWNLITYHKPSFHRPEFFGDLILQ